MDDEDDETTTLTSESSGVRFNKKYLISLPGLLSIGEIILSLAALICAIVSGVVRISGWCGFVAGSALICSITWLVLHLANISSRFHPVVLIAQIIVYGILTLFYVIAASVAATYGRWPPYAAFAVSGFIAAFVYGIDLTYQLVSFYKGQQHTSPAVHSEASSPTTYGSR